MKAEQKELQIIELIYLNKTGGNSNKIAKLEKSILENSPDLVTEWFEQLIESVKSDILKSIIDHHINRGLVGQFVYGMQRERNIELLFHMMKSQITEMMKVKR